MNGMKIYIASPYSAETEEGLEHNTNYAVDIGIKLFKMGHIPYIPHLTHWVDKRAQQICITISWNEYIKWDLEWLDLCDAILYLGESKGTKIELARAIEKKKKIYYSVEDIPQV